MVDRLGEKKGERLTYGTKKQQANKIQLLRVLTQLCTTGPKDTVRL